MLLHEYGSPHGFVFSVAIRRNAVNKCKPNWCGYGRRKANADQTGIDFVTHLRLSSSFETFIFALVVFLFSYFARVLFEYCLILKREWEGSGFGAVAVACALTFCLLNDISISAVVDRKTYRFTTSYMSCARSG